MTHYQNMHRCVIGTHHHWVQLQNIISDTLELAAYYRIITCEFYCCCLLRNGVFGTSCRNVYQYNSFTVYYCFASFFFFLFRLNPFSFINSRTDRAGNEPLLPKILYLIVAFSINYHSLNSKLAPNPQTEILSVIITFVCMLCRGNCTAFNDPIV